jgi:hypothetical protein
MPNTYVPYDLKVKDITARGAVLAWEVHNTIEYMAGTTYDVAISTDGGATFLPATSSGRKEIIVPLLQSEFHFKVRSASPVLGISDYSPICIVAHKIGSTDAQSQSTISVTESGAPSKLITLPDGALKVGGEIEVTGLSTLAMEATLGNVLIEVQAFKNTNSNYLNSIRATVISKSDEIFNNINTTRSAIVNSLTGIQIELDKVNPLMYDLIDKVDESSSDITSELASNTASIEVKLEDIKSKLDLVTAAAVASNKPKILHSEIVLSNVTDEGTTVFLPWKQASIVNRVTVMREFGSATKWTIEILNKNFPVTSRNVVMKENSYESYDPDRYDILRTFSFVNIDGQDLIGIRLTPDTGTSNIFYVCITGTEAQY